jgi:hypothetical protein
MQDEPDAAAYEEEKLMIISCPLCFRAKINAHLDGQVLGRGRRRTTTCS